MVNEKARCQAPLFQNRTDPKTGQTVKRILRCFVCPGCRYLRSQRWYARMVAEIEASPLDLRRSYVFGLRLEGCGDYAKGPGVDKHHAEGHYTPSKHKQDLLPCPPVFMRSGRQI